MRKDYFQFISGERKLIAENQEINIHVVPIF